MSKRSATTEEEEASLKAGQRPQVGTNGESNLDFEDEFEDEYESEDEIMEAGVDGRPDAEREIEQSKDAMDIDTKEQTIYSRPLNIAARAIANARSLHVRDVAYTIDHLALPFVRYYSRQPRQPTQAIS